MRKATYTITAILLLLAAAFIIFSGEEASASHKCAAADCDNIELTPEEKDACLVDCTAADDAAHACTPSCTNNCGQGDGCGGTCPTTDKGTTKGCGTLGCGGTNVCDESKCGSSKVGTGCPGSGACGGKDACGLDCPSGDVGTGCPGGGGCGGTDNCGNSNCGGSECTSGCASATDCTGVTCGQLNGCDNNCGAGSGCTPATECSPGDTETVDCVDSLCRKGKESRTCSNSGTWNGWSVCDYTKVSDPATSACPPSKPVCIVNPDGENPGTCVECKKDNDCGSGKFCENNACKNLECTVSGNPSPACHPSLECTLGTVVDCAEECASNKVKPSGSKKACIDCTSSAECKSGEYCSAINACKPITCTDNPSGTGCNAFLDCSIGTSVQCGEECASGIMDAGGKCVECNVASDCSLCGACSTQPIGTVFGGTKQCYDSSQVSCVSNTCQRDASIFVPSKPSTECQTTCGAPCNTYPPPPGTQTVDKCVWQQATFNYEYGSMNQFCRWGSPEAGGPQICGYYDSTFTAKETCKTGFACDISKDGCQGTCKVGTTEGCASGFYCTDPGVCEAIGGEDCPKSTTGYTCKGNDLWEQYTYTCGGGGSGESFTETCTYGCSKGECLPPPCTDKDKDGYGSNGDPSCPKGTAVDCKDNDAAINPGATEVCNGKDDNCVNGIDEGFSQLTPLGGGGKVCCATGMCADKDNTCVADQSMSKIDSNFACISGNWKDISDAGVCASLGGKMAKVGEPTGKETTSQKGTGSKLVWGESKCAIPGITDYYYRWKECAAGVCTTDITDNAICDKQSDCVFTGRCFTDIEEPLLGFATKAAVLKDSEFESEVSTSVNDDAKLEVCDPGQWQAPATGNLQGLVKDVNSLSITGASVKVLGTSFQATSDGAGAYSITGIPSGTYDVIASKQSDGFIDATDNSILINGFETTLHDFLLLKPLQDCNDDCTKKDGYCHSDCSGKGLCSFATTETLNKCNDLRPGIVDLTGGKKALCCTGIPYTPRKANAKIAPNCEGSVITNRKIVLFRGRISNMVFVVFDENDCKKKTP